MEKGALQRKKEENQEKGQKIKRKDRIFPNSQNVSQPRSVGPSVRGAGAAERQVIDLEMLMVATRSEMGIGRPFRGASVNAEIAASPIGLAVEPFEMSPRQRSTELQRVGISSVVRLRRTKVELRARV